MIVGVTGYHAAGKDSVADILEELGFTKHSFTEEIDDDLKKSGLIPITRENEVRIANKTREEEGAGIYAKRISKKLKRGKNYVITSIRHPEEAKELAKNPNFTMFFVDAPEITRFERIKKRNSREDPTTWEGFKKITKKEENIEGPGQQLHKMKELARVVIINNSTKEVLKSKVLRAVADFSK